jgi:hypothetical protein
MDTAQFWGIIEESRAGFDPSVRDGNMDEQLRRFEAALGGLTPELVVEFQRELERRMDEAYRWDLWGAAYIIEGGCSDDGFTDFRSWLISMGRDVYVAALRDPESLVDVADASGVETTSFEEFQYVPTQVYEDKTEKRMPNGEGRHAAEPAGAEWQEDSDELARRWPKLWAKYAGR